MALDGVSFSATVLIAALLLDSLIGDPQYRFHPIRLIGRSLSFFERLLRRMKADGYAGGCVLFFALSAVWVVLPTLVILRLNAIASLVLQIFIVYSLFAMRDLLDHVWAVQRAADVEGARKAIAMIVGRDTARMDSDACRRAAIESLAENFVDGFLSPLFWYAILGLPGLLLFKIVSTMDSMVGYKTSEYLRFGWCGARLDDAMNYLPARLGWFLLGVAALVVPGASSLKGWRIGLAQHSIVPGPNPGWSECTMAGLIQRRLIGPIWRNGVEVTSIWLGDPQDPPAGTVEDVSRAVRVVVVAALISVVLGIAIVWGTRA